MSYDPEVPVRADAFFLSGVPPSSWSDFSSGGNNFKPNIGVVLDRCAVAPAAANDGPTCEGATINLQSSASGAVTFSWTGPNGFSSGQQNPSIPNATPAASGIYSVTVNGCSTSATTTVTVVASGAGCNDGNACTVGEVCGAGVCGGGAPITAPPETAGVAAAADKTTYTWSAATFATQYDVVRGNTGALPVGPGGGDEFCFDNLPGASVNDGTVPSAGVAFWYLSRERMRAGSERTERRATGRRGLRRPGQTIVEHRPARPRSVDRRRHAAQGQRQEPSAERDRRRGVPGPGDAERLRGEAQRDERGGVERDAAGGRRPRAAR